MHLESAEELSIFAVMAIISSSRSVVRHSLYLWL